MTTTYSLEICRVGGALGCLGVRGNGMGRGFFGLWRCGTRQSHARRLLIDEGPVHWRQRQSPAATPSIDCNTALWHRLVCSHIRRSHPAFTRDIARALGEAVPPTLTTTHDCPPNRRRNEEPDEKQDTCASISRSGSKQMYAKIQHLNDGMAKSSSRLSKFAENFFILSRSVD